MAVVWFIAVLIALVGLGGYAYSSRMKEMLDEREFTPMYLRQGGLPPLWTFNGLGFTLYGDFRNDGQSSVRYVFFTILFKLPIFPVGCIRTNDPDSDFLDTRVEYKIYGKEKWDKREILWVYMRYWGLVVGIISGFLAFFLLPYCLH